MLRFSIKNKHLARFAVAVMVFLSAGIVAGVRIVDSADVSANGTWSLVYHGNGTDINVPGAKYCTPELDENEEKFCTYTLSDKIPFRKNYTFLGWAKHREYTVPDYQPGETITTHNPTRDLYAVWEPMVFVLDFDVNGGEGEVESQSCRAMPIEDGDTQVVPGGGLGCDDDIDPSELEHDYMYCYVLIPETVPTREGYAFLGWGIEAEAITPVAQPGDTVKLEKERTTVYALWAPIYSLYLDTNGGTSSVDVLTCHSTTTTIAPCTVVIPADKPVKDGYNFLGWDTSSAATTVVYNPGDEVILGAGRGEVTLRATKRGPEDPNSMTLYAVWDNTLPVPDTGIVTGEFASGDMINNAIIYISVPTALLLCGYAVKRSSKKKVNFKHYR